MNGKKANWSFLITILCYIGVIISIGLFFPFIADSIFLSNLVCEIVVAVPIFLFVLDKDKFCVDDGAFHFFKCAGADAF